MIEAAPLIKKAIIWFLISSKRFWSFGAACRLNLFTNFSITDLFAEPTTSGHLIFSRRGRFHRMNATQQKNALFFLCSRHVNMHQTRPASGPHLAALNANGMNCSWAHLRCLMLLRLRRCGSGGRVGGPLILRLAVQSCYPHGQDTESKAAPDDRPAVWVCN